MRFKYHNLSPGLIGETSENMVLNSQYLSLLLQEIKISTATLSQVIIFPQKIPRSDFYKELYDQETDFYKTRFDEIIAILTTNHVNSLKSLISNNSEENAREYINWSNILSRYAQFEHLICFSPKNYVGPHLLEIEQLKENAKIDLFISQDKNITVHEQLELADRFLEHPDTSEREKIRLLNQIIVNFYKYQKQDSDINKIFFLSKTLLEIILKIENNDFLNMLDCSIAYRGLSMVTEFDHETQESFLSKAETMARNLPAKTEREIIIAKDNLFPCVQTLAKWTLTKKEIKKAEHYLQEMTTLDPYDSTGYSELGFFYFKIEDYDKAAIHFLKAITLGPPGTGMNAYYYAKTLEQLGKENEAVTYFYESTKLDPQAISPWLDLMNYYISQNQDKKVTEIANHIYTTSNLLEQLEDDETIFIHNYI